MFEFASIWMFLFGYSLFPVLCFGLFSYVFIYICTYIYMYIYMFIWSVCMSVNCSLPQAVANECLLVRTSLLTEAIYVKQVLQFLVNDMGGLGSQRCVEMRLRLDSTSAQAFFTRLGPGRAKHLSTRLLWTQQAMRRQWFVVDRINFNKGEPCRPEHKGFVTRAQGISHEAHWIGL